MLIWDQFYCIIDIVSYQLYNKILNKIRDIIIESFHPNKIILFGSKTTGRNRDDSDYPYIILQGEERVCHLTVNHGESRFLED